MLPTNCLKCPECIKHKDRMYVSYECRPTHKEIELDNPGHAKPRNCPLKNNVQKQHK